MRVRPNSRRIQAQVVTERTLVEKPFYYCPLTILQHDVDEMRATLLNMTVDERSKYLQDRKARRNRWMSVSVHCDRTPRGDAELMMHPANHPDLEVVPHSQCLAQK